MAVSKRKPQTQGPRVIAPTAGELPVTRAMLGEVRTELLERIDQSKRELRAEIHEVKAEIQLVNARFEGLQADIHGVKAEVARVALLVEEQNARNKIVLDGIVAMMGRQERVEHRVDKVEETVRGLASAHASG